MMESYKREDNKADYGIERNPYNNNWNIYS